MDNRPPLNSFKQRPPLESFSKDQNSSQPNILDQIANETPIAMLARGAGSVAGGGNFDISPKPINNSEMGATDYLTKQVPESALSTTGKIADAFIHPIKTAGDIANVGMGMVEKYSPFSMVGKMGGVLPNEMPHEKYFKGVVDNYATKYGSPNKALNTLYHDPFGVGLDASMVTEPFNGALRKAAVDTTTGTIDTAKNAVNASGKILHNTNLGEDINPNIVTPAIKENLSSMNPTSLESLKINPDAIAEAQSIKSKYGINYVPRIEDAEDNFGSVIRNMPKDSQIPPTNTANVINQHASRLDPSDVAEFRKFIQRTPSYPEAMSGMAEPVVPRNLSPQEFSDLRRRAVDMTQNGNNPFGQAVKSALDNDASVVSPELAKAKAQIRLAHIMKPVTSYLDNPNFEINNEDMLRNAQDVSQTARRQKLSGLLGGKSKEVFDALKTDKRQQSFLKGGKKLLGLGAEGGGIYGLFRKALGK